MPSKIKKLKLSDEVVFRQFAGNDGILLNLTTKNYYSLNQTACHIVKKLKKGSSKDLLVKSLVSNFNAPLKAAKKDVDSVLNLFKKDKIII